MKRSLLRAALAGLVVLGLSLIGGLLPAEASVGGLEVIPSRDQYPLGNRYLLLLRIQVTDGWYIHGCAESEDGLYPTVLAFKETPGIRILDIQFPPPTVQHFEYAPEGVPVYSGTVVVPVALMVTEDAPLGPLRLSGTLSYQSCSATACLPPEDRPFSAELRVVPAGAPSNVLHAELFESLGAEIGAQPPAATAAAYAGLWLTLLGIFLGGLALNLTPCIYPLIPITVSYFGGRTGASLGNRTLHGAVYILGLAMMNSTLGLVASFSGGLLGQTLQSPIVLIVVACILLGLGLSFFGLWEIRVPASLNRLASKSYRGLFGTFFMGLTLGIMAAPCLGPFLLGLLTFVGQKGDPFFGFLCFFILSVGLGLPLAVLAVFSGALSHLPMSGLWMVWIRKVFGWILVAMAAYILQPLLPSGPALPLLMALILGAAALHLLFSARHLGGSWTWRLVSRGIALAFCAVAAFYAWNAYQAPPVTFWTPYQSDLLDEARQKGQPVVIDFYADWCGPCKAMEQNVFSHPAVARATRGFVRLRVDFTTRHPEQARLQEMFRIRGVPTIVFLDGTGREAAHLRIEGYVDRESFLKRLQEFPGASPQTRPAAP